MTIRIIVFLHSLKTVVVDLQEIVQKECTFGMKHNNSFSPYGRFSNTKIGLSFDIKVL